MIQSALDEVACRGGGVLRFDKGDYVTGTLNIPSGVGIRIERDARILGSVNPYDYTWYAPDDTRSLTGLISAEDASGVLICGEGMIDGRGLDLVLAIDSLHHTGIRVDPSYNTRRMRPSLRLKLLDFSNVDSLRVEGVHLRGPDINVIHNPFPSSITGIPDARIQNVTLENIDITYPGRGTKGMGYIGKYRLKDVPEAVGDYPEFHMFGELPAWAFYVRHVYGLNLRNVTVRKRAEDYRDAVILDDVKGVNGHIEVVTIDAD